MHTRRESLHGMWSSRLAFILAATGSAVGLGNIWRFPYVTAENGGGAFVLVYLGCILVLGLPILISEIMIGRRGRRSPINSLKLLSAESGKTKAWTSIGWMGLVAGLLILSFYSVVAGWTLFYTWTYIQALFTSGPAISDPGATFGALIGDAPTLLIWHSAFMVMTLFVVAAGVEKGLERAVRFLMPALFVLLLVLAGYGMTTGHFGEAVSFLFTPDFSKISGSTVIEALGQAFFTLSLGMGAIMAYGAYLPRDISVPRTAATVALADTGVALVAGLAIFPIVFAYGIDPGSGGPGLIFTSLPNAFEAMPFGTVYGMLFFALLSVAAWTSSISLLEPAVAYLVESMNMRRGAAAILVGAVGWGAGILSVLSFNVLSDVKIAGRDIQGFIEHVAANIMLPLGGLLIALFAGWALSRADSRDELVNIGDGTYNVWRSAVRYLAPILVLIVLASTSGLQDWVMGLFGSDAAQ